MNKDEQAAFDETIEQYKKASEPKRLEMRFYLHEMIEDEPSDPDYKLLSKKLYLLDRGLCL